MDAIHDTCGEPVPQAVVDRLKPSNYRKISRISGLSHSHVSRVLRGKSGVTLHIAAVICQAADVRLDHLYNYILRLPHKIEVRTRRTRKVYAKSVFEPIPADAAYPEPPPKLEFPVPVREKYLFP